MLWLIAILKVSHHIFVVLISHPKVHYCPDNLTIFREWNNCMPASKGIDNYGCAFSWNATTLRLAFFPSETPFAALCEQIAIIECKLGEKGERHLLLFFSWYSLEQAGANPLRRKKSTIYNTSRTCTPRSIPHKIIRDDWHLWVLL